MTRAPSRARLLGDPEPGKVAAEHDDVASRERRALEQPRPEIVDPVHVREVGAGDRRTPPARAGGDDHRVGTGRDHRVGVEPFTDAHVDAAQLELVLEPPQEVGVHVGGGGGVRPASAEHAARRRPA